MNHLRNLLLLPVLAPGADFMLLLLRWFVGAFLIWGVWDNIISAERMIEFARFLEHHGFAAPNLMARLSVWAQLLIGLSLVLGLAARWGGLLCAVNFAVALWMVDAQAGLRASFPAACLMLLGLYLATHGAGRFALDTLLARPLPDRGR